MQRNIFNAQSTRVFLCNESQLIGGQNLSAFADKRAVNI